MKFFSQVGQDRYLWENFFRGKRGGVFVDIGAYDGEKFSNSAFFERSMGWTGLCIEPMPETFAKLTRTRRAICENLAVSDTEGEADFTIADDFAGPDEKMLSGLTEAFQPKYVQRLGRTRRQSVRVKVTTLAALLEKHKLFEIDYCSIDVEGAEMSILSGFDPSRFRISIFSIENNYDDNRLADLMASKGYDCVAVLEQDLIFKRKDIPRLPQTSVICAVWHKDPGRARLLEGHAENLSRQSVPVERIYVFDGGDIPPSGLKGRIVTAAEPLSIYQAWNLALALAETPFAMNLNLDDRLAPDAVEIMENELRQSQAAAISGDWRICYSQEEADRTEPCYPAVRLPALTAWPPTAPRDVPHRLSSFEGGTCGPATMWRTDLHMTVPRIPWRFSDGSKIKVAGDLAWWLTLTNKLRVQIVRLPLIIGNYHSHPSSQAEFRYPDERPLFSDPGVSLI